MPDPVRPVAPATKTTSFADASYLLRHRKVAATVKKVVTILRTFPPKQNRRCSLSQRRLKSQIGLIESLVFLDRSPAALPSCRRGFVITDNCDGLAFGAPVGQGISHDQARI